MSPKTKSVLSVLVLVLFVGFFLFKNLAAYMAILVSPIGLILSILVLLLILHFLYKILLKIYS